MTTSHLEVMSVLAMAAMPNLLAVTVIDYSHACLHVCSKAY